MIKRFFKEHKSHSKIVPYLDFLFLLRPVNNFCIWVMICVGMYLSTFIPTKFNQEPLLFVTSFDFSTLILFIGFTCLFSGISIINQIKDKKSDEVNKKLFLINKKYYQEYYDKIKIVLILVSLFLLLFVHWLIMMFAVIIYIFYGYLYNENSFRLKKSPFGGMICKTIVGIFLIYSGFVHFHGISQLFNFNFIFLSLPYILFFISISLLIDIPDIKGDKIDDIQTFALFYGEKTTVSISLIANILAFLIAFNSNDPLASVVLIVSFPFFIYALLRGMKKDILRAIRYPISIINLFAMTIYPYLFIPVFIIFYLSKYYYWHRFNLHYPTMLVDD